jgi:hypothetical protein
MTRFYDTFAADEQYRKIEVPLYFLPSRHVGKLDSCGPKTAELIQEPVGIMIEIILLFFERQQVQQQQQH